MVCLAHQAALDASSRGIPDRLDRPLHLDGRQLLEALGEGAAICSALKGDGLVPGTTCVQRGVVAGILRLARHQNGSCHNNCIADRYRRNDIICVRRRSRRGLAFGALSRMGSLRDHDQCGRGRYDDLRGTLRNFGLKVGVVGTVKFEARIRELVENLPDLAGLVEPLLMVRRVLREQFSILHRRLLAIVRDDEVCRRLMTVPGVGPVVALTYRATVDVPARFRNSKAVGAVFGLTPSRYQSGEINRAGAISKCGDEMMRMMLYEAAHIMLVRLANGPGSRPGP